MTARYPAHDTEETALSTEMNALADGSNAIGSAISNDVATTERRLFANFRFTLATQGAARDASGRVDMYIIPEVGGTYAMGDASLDPESGYVGTFVFDAAVTAREQILLAVRLPNSDFKVLVQNNTGQALAATGNTLKMERDGYEDV